MPLDVHLKRLEMVSVFTANITHNLNKMAAEAGLYEVLWRPENIWKGVLYAAGLIPILEDGLAKLKSNPEHYKQWNPKNGWGTYEDLVKFVELYLEACKENPSTKIEVSR